MIAQFDESTLRAYAKFRRLAEVALPDLRQRLERAVGSLGDPYLIRAQIAEPRIKSPSGLARKAQQQGWTFEEALAKAQDLVGFRLICHNLQDTPRVAKIIEESLRQEGFDVQRHDYTARPKRDGYRAIHLVFRMSARLGKDEAEFGCEIQIRSLLQHSWAELSRADVYSGTEPESVSMQRRMLALSKLLARADKIAEGIRTDNARRVRGRRPQSGQPLTDSALAFLYRQRFGQDPPDYLVRSVLRETEGLNVRADGLEVALNDKNLLARLAAVYSDARGWEAETAQMFRWVVLSLVRGKDAAIRRAASEGRATRREIEVIGRREALSAVPTIYEMLKSLEFAQKDEDPESDIRTWASALESANSCAVCGATIVDPDDFADAAVRHYKIRGKKADSVRERLAAAVRRTAVEAGSWSSSIMCSYCDHVLSKDD